MEYKLYKLSFQSAVHFGNGSLDSSEYSVGADTIFSALCIEALKYGRDTLDELYKIMRTGKACISDAFPYMGNEYYVPKPMIRIKKEIESGDSVQKKAYKNLKYIPVSDISKYLEGEFDVLNAIDFDKLGTYDMKVSASIRGHEETEPYRVGLFSFHEENGLYVIVGYENNQELYLIEDLLISLSYSGLGGKRTAGYGRFNLLPGKMPEELKRRLLSSDKHQMTLSGALPKESELAVALDGAKYLLAKRSGFVASADYADNQLRKRDLYIFQAGACFVNRFEGDIYDVSTSEGEHPVYRYAKPLFLGVDV